ncbi:hypothetical protein BaRGS_00005767 [Batillaria attramentaria]|uniref:Uncharacterized protein n=1 Tax=Batillaria attramentaria TaxID=370345 RepID=A0ABD0LUE2_9CAEN
MTSNRYPFPTHLFTEISLHLRYAYLRSKVSTARRPQNTKDDWRKLEQRTATSRAAVSLSQVRLVGVSNKLGFPKQREVTVVRGIKLRLMTTFTAANPPVCIVSGMPVQLSVSSHGRTPRLSQAVRR